MTMSFVAQLWLPTFLSAVVVFVLSAASHMLLPWRRKEWGRVVNYEALQKTVEGLSPGLYAFPAAPDPKDQMKPEWVERWAKGPSGWLTLAAPGPIEMGRNLGLSFLVFLGVSFMVAYLSAQAFGPGTMFRAVFRFVSTSAFMTLGLGSIFHSIWYSRPWRSYLADLFDALVFSFAMAAIFGGLWPR